MCYNAAKGSIFKEIFNVRSKNDIPALIKYWATALKNSYATDELVLSTYLPRWKYFDSRCIQLKDILTRAKRIDRSRWGFDKKLVKQNFYIDSHMLRPYKKYKKEIDELAQCIGIEIEVQEKPPKKNITLFILLVLSFILLLSFLFYRKKKH